jgi:predicted transcriptional regulator
MCLSAGLFPTLQDFRTILLFLTPLTTLLLRRVPMQIILSILTNLEQGVDGKTHLMYRANLDSRALKRYLTFLNEKGFLLGVEKEGHSTFVLTDKGRDFLNRYRDLEGVFA